MNVRDKNKLTRVVAFDYDGVLAMQHNGPDSLEIMKKALLTVYDSREIDPKHAQLFWRTLFQETKGTTEQNMFARFCVLSGFSHTPQKYREYVNLRTELIAVWNREHKIASFDEGKIYPDVYGALDKIKSNPTYRTLTAIVTGNPEPVMRVRAPKELLSRVDYVVGGSRGLSRKDLLDRTRRIAKITFAWAPHYDPKGEIDNLTFIDDVPRGALSHPQEWRSVAIIRPDNPQWEMCVCEDQEAVSRTQTEFLMRSVHSLSRDSKLRPVIIGEGDSYHDLMMFQALLDLGMKPERAYSLVNESTSHRQNSAYMTTSLQDPQLYEFLDPPLWAKYYPEGLRESASAGRRK
jgi:phosphoglycolate phosphatase-like HAD superfamily hydrolase